VEKYQVSERFARTIASVLFIVNAYDRHRIDSGFTTGSRRARHDFIVYDPDMIPSPLKNPKPVGTLALLLKHSLLNLMFE
jgi:hypothetical protein